MARIWTIWLWLLDPDKHSCFLYWVNFYLTNVSSSPPSIHHVEGLAIWEKGRCVSLHTSLELCRVRQRRQLWGKHIFPPCLGGFVRFNEAQTGGFVILSPILASDSNPPMSFPQTPSQLHGPGLHPVLTEVRNSPRQDSSSQPSLSGARQFLH